MASISNLLLTGPSGVGKSTILQSIGHQLPELQVRGFFSEVIWDSGRRVGWRLETFGGDGGILVHLDHRSSHGMGPYGVDMNLLERLVESELRGERSGDVYIIDEIGIIGGWSTAFTSAVRDLLGSSKVVVAALRWKRNEDFTEEVRARSDIEIWEVTVANRESMVGRVKGWLDSTLASGME